MVEKNTFLKQKAQHNNMKLFYCNMFYMKNPTEVDLRKYYQQDAKVKIVV